MCGYIEFPIRYLTAVSDVEIFFKTHFLCAGLQTLHFSIIYRQVFQFFRNHNICFYTCLYKENVYRMKINTEEALTSTPDH